MKPLILIFLLLAVGAEAVHAETLSRVEKLSDAEITELATARANVAFAEKDLSILEKKIADAHGMKGEFWMEWSSRVKFDGNYILLYHQSNMDMQIDMRNLIFK